MLRCMANLVNDTMQIPDEGKSSLSVSSEVATLIRRIARAEGRSRELTRVLQDMASAYLERAHPEWGSVPPKKRKK